MLCYHSIMTTEEKLQLQKQRRICDAISYHTYYDYNNNCLAYHHKLCLAITILRLQALKSLNYDLCLTAIMTTIVVAVSTRSMGVSHTGISVSEYGISMHSRGFHA